jgi:hypothetical protein
LFALLNVIRSRRRTLWPLLGRSRRDSDARTCHLRAESQRPVGIPSPEVLHHVRRPDSPRLDAAGRGSGGGLPPFARKVADAKPLITNELWGVRHLSRVRDAAPSSSFLHHASPFDAIPLFGIFGIFRIFRILFDLDQKVATIRRLSLWSSHNAFPHESHGRSAHVSLESQHSSSAPRNPGRAHPAGFSNPYPRLSFLVHPPRSSKSITFRSAPYVPSPILALQAQVADHSE